jgi:RsiW-degrading membrane proteinase PrsW (M82 family)
MPISFSCPNCGRKLKAPEAAAGKTLPCPSCRTVVTVPAPTAPLDGFDPDWLSDGSPAEAKKNPLVKETAEVYEASEEAEPPSIRPTAEIRKMKRPQEVLRADETPGWQRHLHWALLLALVPLIISLGFTTNRQEAFDNFLDSLRDLDEATRTRLFEAMDRGDEDGLFRALPEHKFKGAWLPRDTKMHWALALGSTLVFFVFLFLLALRGTANLGHLLITAVFTATVGILLLLAVQAISDATQGRIVIGRGIFTIFFYIFKFIGFSYRAALDSDNGFFLSFLGFTFGVGLCEELCKAIPVMLYLRREDANWHGALLWGLASGIGFGVAEGVMYSSDFYNGVYGPGIYFVRFFSCVALHATFSGSVAILLILLREHVSEAETWAHSIAMVLLAIIPTMVLHGLFDTFLKRDLNLGALVTAIVSFGYVAVLSYFLHGKDDVEANAAMLRRYQAMRK